METMTDQGYQLKLAALDRAINYHSHLQDAGSCDEVIQTARSFEQYLRGTEPQ